MTSLTRFASGLSVGNPGPRPEQLITLYEFEGCPFCRKVREALTVLDLEAMILPCPKQGPRHRQALIERGGKAQFPYLVDPNTGTEMYESDRIVAYLFKQYGAGRRPLILLPGPHNTMSAMVSAMVRPISHGKQYVSARAPDKPLTLYSFEASPYCRFAREALSSLELEYHLINVGKGSANREAFVARSGRMMVPWLADPNTGAEMFESGDIVDYLYETYAQAGAR